jgi:hypothetical protein
MFWGCELRRKEEILLQFRGHVISEVNSSSAPKKGEIKKYTKINVFPYSNHSIFN